MLKMAELSNKLNLCYNYFMSRNEKIIKSVEANFALEGMKFSEREKKNMTNYLNGKITFDDYLNSAIARHKRKNI